MELTESTDINTKTTADIVSAYVANNSLAATELSKLIGDVHAALERLAKGPVEVSAAAQKLVPAVPIKKSVTADFIICLEDGKRFKSLKRHLATSFGLTPAEYRAKWGLPDDYPIVAPNYAAQRSALAKAVGLGQARKAKTTKRTPRQSTK